MITYFRMKQYFNQTRLLENRYNFSLRAIYIDINSIMFSQSVFTFTLSRPEARPPPHCVDLVSVLLLLCQVSQMCSNFIIPDHQKQSPRYQDSLFRYLESLRLRCCWETLLKLWCWSSQGKLFLIKWSMRSEADFHLSSCTIQAVVALLCLQMQCYGITQ